MKPLNLVQSIAFILILCILSLKGKSQSLSFEEVDVEAVCGVAQIKLKLHNDTGEELTNLNLSLELPCGLEYAIGTISPGKETNTSDLQNPKFSFDQIGANTAIDVFITINLPCAVRLCIDQGEEFSILATLQAGSNTVTTQSPPFNIDSPNLIFTSITNTFYELVDENTFERIIQIKNTRLGSLDSFFIEEIYNRKEYEGVFSEGQLVNKTDLSALYKFDKEVISKFGDLDDQFELNETIQLRQTVKITACPQEITDVESTFSLYWGCYDQTCQIENRSTLTNLIVTEEGGDEMASELIGLEPHCYKDDDAIQTAIFTNNSPFSNFTNLSFTINVTDRYSGIEEGSIQLDIDSDRYQIEYLNEQTTQCQNFNKSAIVYLDQMNLGETFEITWTNVYCDTLQCDVIGSGWAIEYVYKKDCAPPSDVVQIGSKRYNFQQILGDVESTFTLQNDVVISEGSILNIVHNFDSEALLQDAGSFYLEYILPCGFEYIDNDHIINGIAPTDVVQITNDTASILQIYFDLPFGNGSGEITVSAIFNCDQMCLPGNCEKEFLGTCPGPCQELNPILGVVAGMNILMDSDCPFPPQIKSNEVLPQLYDCEKTVCIDSLPGWVAHQGVIKRHTIGLVDMDNDGTPDSEEIALPQSILHNRVMIGDTFDLEISGHLNIDFQNERTKRLYANVQYKYVKMTPIASEFGGDGAFADLIKNNGLNLLSVSGRLIKKQSGQQFNIEQLLPHSSSTDQNFVFDLNIDRLIANGDLPPESVYESGDSLFLTLSYVLNYNFQSSRFVDVDPSVLEVDFATGFGFDDTVGDQKFTSTSCACEATRLYIASIQYTKQAFGPYIPLDRLLCANDQYQFRKISMAFGIRPDFFPNEYRSIYFPYKIVMHPQEYYEVSEANVAVRNRNNQVIWEVENLNWFEEDQTKYFDIPKFHLDEYCKIDWEYTISILKDLACKTTKASSNETARVDYLLKQEDPINLYIPLEEELNTELTFTINYPEFILEFDKDFSESFTDTVFWDFTIANESPYAVAIHPYLNIVTNSNFIDLRLTNLETGQEVIPISEGTYLFEDLSQGERRYRLASKMKSCNVEILQLKYGWDCDVFDEFGTPPCFQKQLQLTGYVPPATAEVNVTNSSLVAPLCDTSDWVEVSFFNAGLGPMFSPYIQAKLPLGTTYVQGSSQIFNPETGFFESLTTTVLNDTIVWVIDDVVNQFLPGQGVTPLVELKIRYKLQTSCDFTSGKSVIYTMHGKQNCGRKTNVVRRVSSPIIIQNSDVQPSIEIEAQSSPNACSDLQLLTLSIERPTHSENNQLIATLPFGSIIRSDNSGWTSLVDQHTITLDLPDGIINSTITIQYELPNNIECGTQLIEVIATGMQNSYCTAEGEDCLIDVLLGSKYLEIDIVKPQIEISGSNIKPHQNGYDLEVIVHQISDSLLDEGNVILFLDNDFSGTYNQGDVDIHRNLYSFNANEDTIRIENLDLNIDDFCNLYLLISADENCICEDVYHPFFNSIIITETIQTCANEGVVLGVEDFENAQYSWDNYPGLSCNNCSTAEIHPPYLTEAFGINQTVEFNDQCHLEVQHNVLVIDTTNLSQDQISVCQGDTLSLHFEDKSIIWNGEGILEQSDQHVLIFIENDGTFQAMITDENGCNSIDTLLVEVEEKPIYSLQDTTFCYGQNGQIKVEFDELYDVNWINNIENLSDHQIPDPTLLNPVNGTYLVEIGNGLCTTLDSVRVVFYDGLEVSLEKDSIYFCLEDDVEIDLPPEYIYTWNPSNDVFCLDQNCSMVTISNVTDIQDFIVAATSTASCKDTFPVVVVPIEDKFNTDQNLYFCKGDSVFFQGTFITEERVICDTTGLRCEIINCTTFLYYTEDHQPYYEVTINEGESIELILNETYTNYTWADDPTLNCLDCSMPTATPMVDTEYQVTVETDQGCLIPIRYKVNVLTSCFASPISIPNVFSPNGNGENEIFRVPELNNVGEQVIDFAIFNEWGMMLINKSDNSGWDGTYKGEKAPPGTYLYMITLQCANDGNKEKISGSVTLIR